MARRKSTASPAPTETSKTEVSRVLVTSVTSLNIALSHLRGVLALLGYIENGESNEWAYCLSHGIQGVEQEIEEVRNYIGRASRR